MLIPRHAATFVRNMLLATAMAQPMTAVRAQQADTPPTRHAPIARPQVRPSPPTPGAMPRIGPAPALQRTFDGPAAATVPAGRPAPSAFIPRTPDGAASGAGAASLAPAQPQRSSPSPSPPRTVVALPDAVVAAPFLPWHPLPAATSDGPPTPAPSHQQSGEIPGTDLIVVPSTIGDSLAQGRGALAGARLTLQPANQVKSSDARVTRQSPAAELELRLAGVVLRVWDSRIHEIVSGSCNAVARLSVAEAKLAERTTREIMLPARIHLGSGFPIPVPQRRANVLPAKPSLNLVRA
jgi:hypothetical protein